MKNPALCTLIAFAATVLLGTSCKSMMGTEEQTVIETPDGAAIVDTWRMSATITAIDAPQRRMTLQGADGGKTTVKADKSVDMSQFKVGDRVAAMVTEEVAVFLRKSSAPPSVGEGASVGLATAGANRAMWMAETVQVTAKVTRVDAQLRKVTLQFPDEKSRTVKVAKRVNLANVTTGDDVTVQVTEAIAVDVDKV